MTIKTKLLLLSVAGVLPAIVIALTGHETIVQMDSATRGIVTSGAALRNHWEGDMMHEGLRADVYATLAAGTDPEKQRVRTGLAEHAKRFRDAVARNRSLALDSRIGSALSELGPSLEAYIREAEAITAVAANDRNAAVQRLPAFEKAFEALDAAQAKVSELIQNSAESAQIESGRAARASGLLIFQICIVMLLSMGVAVWFLARSISRPLLAGIQAIRQGSSKLHAVAGQIASASENLSSGASEQVAALEETSASSQEISSVSKGNAQKVREAGEFMQEASRQIDGANSTLGSMLESMDEMIASSKKISRIIKVVDEIAFQTNILALNAAVEAARAGEAGAGFSVVAGEVRNLAQRCTTAATETAGLIQDSIAKSHEGKAKLDGVVQSIRGVTGSAARVNSLIEEVTAASREQAHGVEQISVALQQIEQTTQRTAAIAVDSSRTSDELNSESNELRVVVEHLSALVGGAATTDVPEATESEQSQRMFEWNARFETGIEEVDAQHRRLFEFAADLQSAMRRGDGDRQLQDLLRNLIQYTATHFRSEELMMRSGGYPDFAAHKARHDDLAAKVTELASKFEEGTASLSIELLTFLRDWLCNHILKSDMAFARYVAQAARARRAPAR